VLSEKLSGEYRYVKLLVFGVPDKTVKKTIAALEVYAEDPAETEPPTPGTTSRNEPGAETGGAQTEGVRDRGNLLKTAVPVLAGILLCAGAAALLFGRRRKKG
jgi:LPXTG-motif cell wall-anchored protein